MKDTPEDKCSDYGLHCSAPKLNHQPGVLLYSSDITFTVRPMRFILEQRSSIQMMQHPPN